MRYATAKLFTDDTVSSSTTSSSTLIRCTEPGVMALAMARYVLFARIMTLESFMPPPVEPDMGPVIMRTSSSDQTNGDHSPASTDT